MPRDGQQLNVTVDGDRVANDSDVVRRWAIAGENIAYRSRIDMQHDLAGGRLVALRPDWQGKMCRSSCCAPTAASCRRW
jgi:DNA-binding transcriptional LysR family regulator